MVRKTTVIACRTRELIDIMERMIAISSQNHAAGESTQQVAVQLETKSGELKGMLSQFRV